MEKNSFNDTLQSLFKGMDSFISTKTVVGEAVHIGDTIILPLVDVTFGVGAGAFNEDDKNNAGGGMGGKLVPSAVLVISKGSTKLVNVKNQDGITKILDMVPDMVNKVSDFVSDRKKDDDVVDYDEEEYSKAKQDMEDIINDSVNAKEE